MSESEEPMLEIDLESESKERWTGTEAGASDFSAHPLKRVLDQRFQSWGRYPYARHEVRQMFWRDDALPLPQGTLPGGELGSVLPYGRGRSYGDSCLNDGQAIITTSRLDRFISFDRESGVLVCEAGVGFDEIIRHLMPLGWFPAVTPGTKFVTVGGAIANDVHGKNHHSSGTFGRFVRRFELLRSDGSRRICSPEENPELYSATIGGMGLTGLVTWAEIQLRRIENPFIDVETIRFGGLDEFFALSAESMTDWEYVVSWVDCLSTGKKMGRGLFMRGRHAHGVEPEEQERLLKKVRERRLTVPFELPSFLLNGLTMQMAGYAYYRRQWKGRVRGLQHYEPYFYPLDGIGHWNRAYGSRGFLQYQCVLPMLHAREASAVVLRWISESGLASFINVFKVFGAIESPGMMSFPREGVTLAVDFANHGDSLFKLLDRLNDFVGECGGAVYPAKDARMAPECFKAFFPRWEEFSQFVDPRFSSSFWRRVMGQRQDASV